MSHIILNEGAAPATPDTGKVVLYPKTDGKLYSKDDAGTETELGGGAGSDELAKVSANDTTAGYLNGKLVAGSNISFTENNDGGNETLTIAASGGSAIDHVTTLDMWEDFVTGAEDPDELGSYVWRTSQNGAGTAPARISAENGHPGIIRLQSGTTGTTRSCIHLGQTGAHTIFPAGGEITHEVIIRVTGTLTAFSRLVAGLGDITGAVRDQDNGIYFSFDKTLADTTFHLVAASAATRTRRDTTQTVVSGTWYKLKFVLNAAANSIQAYVNGVAAGLPITTNIPVTALSPLFKIDGVAAGSQVQYDIDFFGLKQMGLTR